MAIVVGSPLPADELSMNGLLPAIRMQSETRGGYVRSLRGQVLSYIRYSSGYGPPML